MAQYRNDGQWVQAPVDLKLINEADLDPNTLDVDRVALALHAVGLTGLPTALVAEFVRILKEGITDGDY